MANMLTVPNCITLLRALLIPVLVYLLLTDNHRDAFIVFAGTALGDLADGYIARRFNQVSRFGAALDPIVDKLTMLAVALLLAWQELLPAWLAAAIVLRDVVIVAGAVAYHFLVGRLEPAPTLLSKANTLMEFATLAAVLADTAAVVEFSPWLPGLFALVFVTILMSGLHYVWTWGWKALHHTRRARS
ncbi:MAG: CDP-alcohol phosphatidyltransferase family protein [Pseudomonadota bacterium]|jgi:cardiolipin synthase